MWCPILAQPDSSCDYDATRHFLDGRTEAVPVGWYRAWVHVGAYQCFDASQHAGHDLAALFLRDEADPCSRRQKRDCKATDAHRTPSSIPTQCTVLLISRVSTWPHDFCPTRVCQRQCCRDDSRAFSGDMGPGPFENGLTPSSLVAQTRPGETCLRILIATIESET